MKVKYLKIFGALIAFSTTVYVILAFTKGYFTPIYFDIPKGWPKPQNNFSKNPLTEEGFQLGRALFYDPILSKDNTISCSSCLLRS